MPFREKSAWISLLSTLLIWGYFFGILVREIGTRNPDGGALMGAFIGCTIALVVVQVTLQIAIAIAAPKEAEAPADERERLIELEASRIAFMVMGALVLAALLTLPVLAVAGPLIFKADPVGGSLTALGGGVFFALVLGEIVHAGWQILLFRRRA